VFGEYLDYIELPGAERKVVPPGRPLVVLYAADLDGIGGRRFHVRDPNGNEIAVWPKAG